LANGVTKTDLGVGDARAPVGTEPWARRWRVELYSMVRNMDQNPESVETHIHLGEKFDAWRLLKNKEGNPFSSLRELCEAPNPYGIEYPYDKLIAFLEIVHGKRTVQLATVAPAQPGPGRGHEKDSAERKTLSGHSKESALRAILRAPIEVQELYRDGLISQKLAAQLGPKKAEKAKPREEVAAAIKAVARDRKAIDDAVRNLLGQRKPTRVEQAVKLVAAMTARELERFFESVEQYRRSL
jgi:hypothetical protein